MPRILIVDDEPEIRTVYSGLLRHAGYEVETAADGRAAVRVLRRASVQLILCDILMPEADGLETIVAVRSRHPDVKVIAMSGGGTLTAEECLTLAAKLGAHATLRKPFSATQLMELVVSVLAPEPAT